jgi:hypothetical protein
MLTPEELKKITKEQFFNAYNQHLPNKWIKFAYKYFSKNNENNNFIIKQSIIGLLIILVLFGFFGTIFNINPMLIKFITIIYSVILSIFVLYLFSAIILNNIRINKIRKILNVSKEQYNYLANKFYST